MSDLRSIQHEIESGLVRFQNQLGIENAEPSSCGGVESRHAVASLNSSGGSKQRLAGVAPCPQETPKTIGHALAEWAMIGCIVACAGFIFIVKAKAQVPTEQEMFAPYEIRCDKVQEQLTKLRNMPKYRDAVEVTPSKLSKWLSHQVFGYAPAVEHFILITTTDGRTILLPCVFGNLWAGKESNAIQIDMEWKRGLVNPKTEINLPADEQPKRTRKSK